MLYLKGTKIEQTPNGETAYIRCVIAIEASNSKEIFRVYGDDILFNGRYLYSFEEDILHIHNTYDGKKLRGITNKNTLTLRGKGVYYDLGVSNNALFLYRVWSIEIGHPTAIDIIDIYGDIVKTVSFEKKLSYMPTKNNFHDRLFFRSREGICIVDLNIDEPRITYLSQFPFSLISNSEAKDIVYILSNEEVYKYNISADKIIQAASLNEIAASGRHRIVSSRDGSKLLVLVQIYEVEDHGYITKHIFSKVYFHLFNTNDLSAVCHFYSPIDYSSIDLSYDGLTFYGLTGEIENGTINTVIDTIDLFTGHVTNRTIMHGIALYDIYAF